MNKKILEKYLYDQVVDVRKGISIYSYEEIHIDGANFIYIEFYYIDGDKVILNSYIEIDDYEKWLSESRNKIIDDIL